jgi:osmotically-inducible protein OsmY
VGFPSAPATTEPGAVLSSIFDRSAQVRTVKRWPVTVTVQGETAVLRGRVATDHDRLLAEALAQMQPGIWKVQNELVVESPASPSSGTSNAAR